MSIITRIAEYGHGNQNLAFVDSDFVRGGIRVVANTTDLYGLDGKIDQLKEYVSLVWVSDVGKFYQLVDTSNIGNESGWSELSTTSENIIDTAEIDGGGNLVINGITVGNVVGDDGAPGAQGVGITNIVDNGDGSFVITTDDSDYTIQTVSGADGANGLSAFETWLSIAGNENGTAQDFIEDITGPAGVNGDNGNSILSGSADPTSEGENGDFYINTTTYNIFGPKTDSGWGSGVLLIGQDGAPGEDGADGENAIITVSQTVTTLPAGEDASVTITDNGTSNPTIAFSIPAGANGQDGADAPTITLVDLSENGDLIVNLSDGTTYNAGYAIGEQGPAGLDGSTILSGSGAPEVTLGVDGDIYLDTDTYEFYGPKLDSNWGSGTSLIGPQGEDGLDASNNLTSELDINVETNVNTWFNRVRNLDPFSTSSSVEDVIRAMFSIYIANDFVESGTYFTYRYLLEPNSTSYINALVSGTAKVEAGRPCDVIKITYRTNTSSPIQDSYFRKTLPSPVQNLYSGFDASTTSVVIDFDEQDYFALDDTSEYRFVFVATDSTDSSSISSGYRYFKRFYRPYFCGSPLNIFGTPTTVQLTQIQDDIVTPSDSGSILNLFEDVAETAPSNISVDDINGAPTESDKFSYIIVPQSWGEISSIIKNGAQTILSDFYYLGTAVFENRWEQSQNFRIYRSQLPGVFVSGDAIVINF